MDPMDSRAEGWNESRGGGLERPGSPPGLEAERLGGPERATIRSSDSSVATGFRRWQHELHIVICAASKRSQQRTMKWIKEVEDVVEVAELDTPRRRWDDLDMSLAAPICTIARGRHSASF